MKKIIFVFIAILSVTIIFTACKETKKGEVKEDVKMDTHDNHNHEKEMALNDVFQCPMNCEKGKTYDKEGSCPVCNMDLQLKFEGNDVKKEANSCKCKEGEDCTCAGGKCECKVKEVFSDKRCTCKEGGECKCEKGKCECKS